MTYKDELTKAMSLLAEHPKTLFVGQSVKFGGQAMHPTFRDVPTERLIEFPVCEDFQMGFCTGLALEGFIPVSIYPRVDFLILATNQLVNHLDKFPLLGISPKVIIRTAVGAKSPLYPGPQHTQDHTAAFRLMLTTIQIVDLWHADDIVPGYELALARRGPTLLVEHMERYDATGQVDS